MSDYEARSSLQYDQNKDDTAARDSLLYYYTCICPYCRDKAKYTLNNIETKEDVIEYITKLYKYKGQQQLPLYKASTEERLSPPVMKMTELIAGLRKNYETLKNDKNIDIDEITRLFNAFDRNSISKDIGILNNNIINLKLEIYNKNKLIDNIDSMNKYISYLEKQNTKLTEKIEHYDNIDNKYTNILNILNKISNNIDTSAKAPKKMIKDIQEELKPFKSLHTHYIDVELCFTS